MSDLEKSSARPEEQALSWYYSRSLNWPPANLTSPPKAIGDRHCWLLQGYCLWPALSGWRPLQRAFGGFAIASLWQVKIDRLPTAVHHRNRYIQRPAIGTKSHPPPAQFVVGNYSAPGPFIDQLRVTPSLAAASSTLRNIQPLNADAEACIPIAPSASLY